MKEGGPESGHPLFAANNPTTKTLRRFCQILDIDLVAIQCTDHLDA